MTDLEFAEKYMDRRYIMLFGGGDRSTSLEEQVEQAMRFGFRPHGGLVAPEPRFYIQAMLRDFDGAKVEGQGKASS